MDLIKNTISRRSFMKRSIGGVQRHFAAKSFREIVFYFVYQAM